MRFRETRLAQCFAWFASKLGTTSFSVSTCLSNRCGAAFIKSAPRPSLAAACCCCCCCDDDDNLLIPPLIGPLVSFASAARAELSTASESPLTVRLMRPLGSGALGRCGAAAAAAADDTDLAVCCWLAFSICGWRAFRCSPPTRLLSVASIWSAVTISVNDFCAFERTQMHFVLSDGRTKGHRLAWLVYSSARVASPIQICLPVARARAFNGSRSS